MTTEMTVYTPAPQQVGMSLTDAMSIGQVLAKSGFFSDAREAAQAVTKVLAGQELGIGPVAAMTGVYLVNGRVAIGANLMAAAVKRSRRYNYRVTELSDARCAIEFTEEGKPIGESVFTIEDARKAQTKNIDKFPRNMLFARAMSNGVRWFCPDVFSTTVYTPDELRGDVLEAPPAPTVVTVNTETGEIVDEAPPPMLPSVRKSLIGELRAAVKEARELGLDPGLGVPAEMSDDQLQKALTTVREMIAAEREALASEPETEAEPAAA